MLRPESAVVHEVQAECIHVVWRSRQTSSWPHVYTRYSCQRWILANIPGNLSSQLGMFATGLDLLPNLAILVGRKENTPYLAASYDA